MARCSEAAQDIHGLMLCCETRGWQYTIESSPVLEADDGAELIPRGHRASVTTTRGYNALVLGTNAKDALRAALTAVESMDARWANGPDVTRVRSISMGTMDVDGEALARAIRSTKLDDGPAKPTTGGQAPEPELIDDPTFQAYGHYDADPRVHGPDDFEAFRDAITRAGLVPVTGLTANGHPGEQQATPDEVVMVDQGAEAPPDSMIERLMACYREYHHHRPWGVEQSADQQAFRAAVERHLGGCFIPVHAMGWERGAR